MQLFSDSRDVDRAIEELQRVLPIAALQNIISERKRKHQAYNQLQRYLQNAVATELRREEIAGTEA